MTTSLINGSKTFLSLSNTSLPVTPASGIVLYSDTGVLKILNSGGTPTTAGGVSFIEITGQNELFLGTGVGNSTLSYGNLGIGPGDTLSSLAGGESNVGLGNDCLSSLTTGTGNVAVGETALNVMVKNNFNVAIGTSAGQSLNNVTADTSSFNTMVGTQAALSLVSGDNNVILGYLAGQTSNNYQRCIAIGNATALGSASENCFVIGSGANITNSSVSNSGAMGAMTNVAISNSINIGNGCNVGFNNASPAYNVDIETISGVCGICMNTSALPSNPSAGKLVLYHDGTNFKYVNSSGTVKTLVAA